VIGLLNSITRSEDSLADVIEIINEGGEPGNFRGSNNCSFEIDKELDELLILDQLGRSRLNPG
jgi:hypothetical protein